jgi:hypothetical protein
MKSYLPFLRYLSEKGLWMDWNYENQEYDVISSKNYVNKVVVSLPAHVIGHDYLQAVETVDTYLRLNCLFQ